MLSDRMLGLIQRYRLYDTDPQLAAKLQEIADGLSDLEEIQSARYAVLCKLIEAIWLKREDDDYYEIDLENLPPLTSPQARKIATFIEKLFT
jgi:hypothetical protein